MAIEFIINKNQARSIAIAIADDIANYIKEHEEEFKEWEKSQESK